MRDSVTQVKPLSFLIQQTLDRVQKCPYGHKHLRMLEESVNRLVRVECAECGIFIAIITEDALAEAPIKGPGLIDKATAREQRKINNELWEGDRG